MDMGEIEAVPPGSSAPLGAEFASAFVLGGRAVFTLENAKTGNRFTYRVSLAPETIPGKVRPYFVAVLTGPDNTANYQYLGCIWDKANPRYIHGAKSRVSSEAPSAKAFAWFVRRGIGTHLPEGVTLYHEGRCGRCGRALTVPESVRTGMGPICSEKE